MTDKPKRFTVTVPIAGSYTTDVEAVNEEDAFYKACDEFDPNNPSGDLQWEFYRHIAQGNICYPTVVHLEVTEIEDDEDDSR